MNDDAAALPAKEEAERHNGEPLGATHSGEITIEPEVHVQPVAGTQPTRAENDTLDTFGNAYSQPAAASTTAHEPSPISSPTRAEHGSPNGSSTRAENGTSATDHAFHSQDSGVSPSIQEPSPLPSPINGSRSANGRKLSHRWQVLSAEKLGLYESPHSTFPTQLPTNDTEAIGTVPNYLPPSNETGLLRRIPQSQDELLQEMEELELKNPSASLQVRTNPLPRLTTLHG